MESLLKIILVEDVETDAELIQRSLKKSGLQFESFLVETAGDFKSCLLNNPPDLILSDYSLPGFNAIQALMIKNEICPEVPFILVTGAQTEEIAATCIKEGADDYILKGNLTRLPTSVNNALLAARSKRETIKALKELKVSEEKYRSIFENSMVGILRWNITDGKIIELNRKAKEFMNLFCVENNLFMECFLSHQDYESLVTALLQSGFIENVEFQAKTKPSVSNRWLSLSAKKIAGSNDVEAVLQDISESKESIIQLQKVNYELDRFVYHASHDLKSPLKGILGLASAARESETLEECLTYVDMFEECAGKLELLVNDLLTLARANRAEELLTFFNFEEEIDGMIKLHEHTELIKNIHVTKHISQPNEFCTDAVRLRIILNNLFSNAIKYHRHSDQGLFINLKVTVSAEKANIEIEDNGQGIAENHLSRIFDMFYRATVNSEGSGLGLYIVKSMVEHIYGTIEVQSAPGKGTSFFLEVPNRIKK